MKLTSFLRSCAIVASVLMTAQAQAAEVAAFVDFEDGQIPRSGCWWFDAQGGGTVSVSKDRSLNYAGSAGSLRGTYPKPTGDLYVWGGCDIASLNTRDVYIEFWAKMPGAKHGLKFVKVFGQRFNDGGGMNIANTTFGLDYTGVDYGSMYSTQYGDGSTIGNDTQSIINFDGSNDAGTRYHSWIGRSYNQGAVIDTPQNKIWSSSNWGTGWHHFKLRVKFNDGTSKENEIPNGELYVEIDDKVYLNAKGLFNRHYTNKPIQAISFFDWSQTGNAPFELWYDNIRITTGGWYSAASTSNAPKPPSQPTIK